MKKTLLISFLALLGITQAVAQDYEYVPFVREGVKWVYFYESPFAWEEYNMQEGIQYYSFEMMDDIPIGNKTYKKVCLTHYLDDGSKEIEDFIPVYLREENKTVYAVFLDSIMHPQCPVGMLNYIAYGHKLDVTPGLEFILYDFNSPTALFDSVFSTIDDYLDIYPYLYTDSLVIGTHLSKCHHYWAVNTDANMIIEGIGYDGIDGMPLNFFEQEFIGFQAHYTLSHVIENNTIIYKGYGYNPNATIGITGDVNGDGEVNIGDANSVIDIVVMGGNNGHTRVPAADLNGDGEVTIADFNAIIAIILKQQRE